MKNTEPCGAKVYHRSVKSYSMQRIALYDQKPCSRRATESVGHLRLCATHARMAREGLLDETGDPGDPCSLRDRRDYPHLKFTWWKP